MSIQALPSDTIKLLSEHIENPYALTCTCNRFYQIVHPTLQKRLQYLWDMYQRVFADRLAEENASRELDGKVKLGAGQGLPYLFHSQMREIACFTKVKNFLEQSQIQGIGLLFSLPSIESWIQDKNFLIFVKKVLYVLDQKSVWNTVKKQYKDFHEQANQLRHHLIGMQNDLDTITDLDLTFFFKNLTQIPSEIRLLRRLQSVDLSNNDLSFVPSNLFTNRPSLSYVSLRGNGIRTLHGVSFPHGCRINYQDNLIFRNEQHLLWARIGVEFIPTFADIDAEEKAEEAARREQAEESEFSKLASQWCINH